LNPVALITIPVGVLVERSKAQSPWLDYTWRAIDVLPGELTAAPWTPVGLKGETDRFFAGSTEIGLYRMEVANYRTNIASGAPSVWVVLRPTGGDPPYSLLTVTADPAEGEAATEAGDDLVEAVAMHPDIRRQVEVFVAEHDVDRPFIKRQRDRPELDPRARRRGSDGDCK
jgi:Protein of unknown function (DUF3305)